MFGIVQMKLLLSQRLGRIVSNRINSFNAYCRRREFRIIIACTLWRYTMSEAEDVASCIEIEGEEASNL